MIKKLTLLMVFYGAIAHQSYAQEPVFTQYAMNQSMFNPAYSVVNDVMLLSFYSRKQWVGIDEAPFTNTMTFGSTFLNNKGAVNAYINNNRYGVSNNYKTFLQFGYKLNFGKNYRISVGLQGGYTSFRNDYTKIDNYSLDPVFNSGSVRTTVPNFGFGIFFNTDDYYIGVSIPEYLEYSTSNEGISYNIQRNIYMSAGAVIPMGVIKWKVHGLYVMSEVRSYYDLATSWLLAETIWVGLFTRSFDAYGMTSSFELGDRVKLGITAELPSTNLVRNQFGTYELSLIFEIDAFRRHVLPRRYF